MPVTPDDLIQAADILEGSHIRRNAAVSYAHRELLRAADGMATASEDATRRAMVLTMYYVAQSQTLKVVRTRYGSVRGHWLCLLYRFKQGQSMIRPAFRSNVIGRESMSQEMLAQWASEVMHEDRNATGLWAAAPAARRQIRPYGGSVKYAGGAENQATAFTL